MLIIVSETCSVVVSTATFNKQVMAVVAKSDVHGTVKAMDANCSSMLNKYILHVQNHLQLTQEESNQYYTYVTMQFYIFKFQDS